MAPVESKALIDQVTIFSLLSTVLIFGVAYGASLRLLAPTASNKTRGLFVWHAYDSLIHFFLEGGYLYNVFFSYTTTTVSSAATNLSKGLWEGIVNVATGKDASHHSVSGTLPGAVSAYLPPNVHFMGIKDRLYGAAYGTNPLAALWREYAKADPRWAGSDLNIVSLELLTVLIGAPLALYICYQLSNLSHHHATRSTDEPTKEAWFWMIILATGELYGGFMTFAPEWLSGNPNLNGANWMHLWLYLVFFNMIWVFIPGWILYEAFQGLVGSSEVAKSTGLTRTASRKKKA